MSKSHVTQHHTCWNRR